MHATALQYAVDSLVSTQDGLDRDMVTRILRAGVDLYTTWFGDPDVADLRQKISAAHIDSGFTREKAYPLLDEASVQIGVLLSRAHQAESRAEEAEAQPWPAWAEDIFKRLKAVGVYDAQDMAEGVDLATDFSEWMDGYETACEEEKTRLNKRIAALESQLAERQAAAGVALIEPAQAAVGRVLAERISYFRRTDGHYDRQQAARSYEATAKEVDAELRRSIQDAIAAHGCLVEVSVVDYRQTDGITKFMVEIKVGGRNITTNIFDVRGRAEFEAAEWEWLLRGGQQPDIADFDVDVTLPAEAIVGTDEDPRNLLEEVRHAVFGSPGSEPDVYQDYDKLSELSGKMSRAIKAVDAAMREREGVLGELHDAKAMLMRTADERMGKAFYVEVCRAEDRIKDLAGLARAIVEKVPGPAFDESVTRMLRMINEIENGTVVPDQVSRVEASLSASPNDIRASGWAVAVHNDYRLDGVPHTFWLFTNGCLSIKGEGLSDADALDQVRAGIARMPVGVAEALKQAIEAGGAHVPVSGTATREAVIVAISSELDACPHFTGEGQKSLVWATRIHDRAVASGMTLGNGAAHALKG